MNEVNRLLLTGPEGAFSGTCVTKKSPSIEVLTEPFQRIRLEGKSKKGKNRIREQGQDWDIIARSSKVLFSSNTGPWMLLRSVELPDKIRWIHLHEDQDFRVVQ